MHGGRCSTRVASGTGRGDGIALPLATVIGGAFWLGSSYRAAPPKITVAADDPRPDLLVAVMVNQLATPREVITARTGETDLDALAQQLAELQAGAIQGCSGARLVDMIGLAPEEFSFGSTPPMGGQTAGNAMQTQASDLAAAMDELATRLAGRVHELEVLEKALLEARLAEQMREGRPVSIGWVSSVRLAKRSGLGRRKPTRGSISRVRWQPDFLGGLGIVTFAGRKGFGNTVEVDHGRGYVDGYKIATMGSSGR